MHSNTFLLLFGLNPNDFTDTEDEVISTPNGFMFEAKVKHQDFVCPHCGSTNHYVHSWSSKEYNLEHDQNAHFTLLIHKPRLSCNNCHKTFTPVLEGIKQRTSIIDRNIELMKNDFHQMITFRNIANKYKISLARVLQIFDREIKYVPRRQMPKVLCIDEIRFSSDDASKYICVLSNYESGEIVDVIENRQYAYLSEYFDKISLAEREKTKIFISDMYDGYSKVREKFFPNATHIIDMFHIVKQLTGIVNRLRTRAMNNLEDRKSYLYKFMKSKWRLFLLRDTKVPNKLYKPDDAVEGITYSYLILECNKTYEPLWNAYNCLQELYKYHLYEKRDDAQKFLNRLIAKLNSSGDDLLDMVATTYKNWAGPITNAFTEKYDNNKRYTNGLAEGNNNALASLIKISYGYHNFERFRKRIMLIATYNKSRRNTL